MTTPGLIKWLNAPRPANTAEVGAKAATLARLTHLGWPIPDGFCITTSAYHRFVHANQFDDALNLSRFAGRTESELVKSCQDIQNSLLSGEIPEDITSTIKIAYEQLQHNHLDELVSVAVRSSSTVEDLGHASFAGIFETFLNIFEYDALLLHVKKCWASLWNVAALIWMMRSGLTSAPYAMAVVVQAMVKAESSGVMFTANPLSGNPFEVLINSTWGLGEGLVSGQTRADTFIIDEFDLRMKARRIADKEAMISGSLCGGTSMHPVEQTKKSVPSISEDQVIHLAQMGLELQRQFGRPQDVEWAIQNGTIYVLQTRPVVALPAYFPPSDLDQQGLHFSKWSLEFRELLSPFGRSLEHLKNPIYYGARSRALGIKITNYRTTINGYIYHHEAMQTPAYLPSLLFQAWQLVRWFISARGAERRYREEVIPSFIRNVTETEAVTITSESLEGLLHRLDKAIKHYLSFEAETILINVLANAFCTLLMRFCTFFLKGSDSLMTTVLFSGVPNKTVERDTALARLIGLADEQGLLPLFDGNYSLPEVVQHLKSNSSGQKFLCEFERFREEFGYVWADGSTKDPGWRENGELILSLFRNQLHGRKSADVDAESYYHTVEARLNSSWIDRLVPLRRQCFRRLVLLAKRYYPYREDHNHYCSSGVMAIRNLLLACGERLVRSGMLNEAEAIFQLTYEEIVKLPQVIEQGTFDKYAELIRMRKVEGERQRRLSPPSVIILGSAPRRPKVPSSDARQLDGIPGSPGVARGPARVVSRTDLGRVHGGDILVCDTFRPEWSPVFRYVRGLVTERGYTLSHGANLAREWGIPAVMGVHMATQVIGDGDVVQVDGGAGLVRVERASRRPR